MVDHTLLRRRAARSLVACCIPYLLAACASASSSAVPRASAEPAGAPSDRHSRNRITETEIRPVEMRTAYDVVVRLRRSWLNSRGVSSFSGRSAEPPVVYVDGFRYGAVDKLRDISAGMITSLDFLEATAATTRFGTGHGSGVILVTLRH